MGLKLLKKPFPCKYCNRTIIWEGWVTDNGCRWCDENHPVYSKENKRQINTIDNED